MGDRKELLRDYIDAQISQADNQLYKDKARQLCDALSEAQLLHIIRDSSVDFASRDQEINQQTIHGLIEALHATDSSGIKSINKTRVGTYIYNMLAQKIITPQNFATVLKENDKYIDEICYQLYGLNQWISHKANYSPEEKNTLLVGAITDPVLEDKLVTFPDRYNANRKDNDKVNFRPYNSFLVHAYLESDQIQKAVDMYDKTRSDGETRFLCALVKKGHIDTATEYVLRRENFRKNLNGSSNRKYKSLLKFFNTLLDADIDKAIDFITHQDITPIWYGNDIGYFIDSMIAKNVPEDRVLNFFASDNVSNKKRNKEPLAGEFEKITKHYGPELVKQIVTANGNKRATILLGYKISEDMPAKEVNQRIKNVYSSYLSMMFD